MEFSTDLDQLDQTPAPMDSGVRSDISVDAMPREQMMMEQI